MENQYPELTKVLNSMTCKDGIDRITHKKGRCEYIQTGTKSRCWKCGHIVKQQPYHSYELEKLPPEYRLGNFY